MSEVASCSPERPLGPTQETPSHAVCCLTPVPGVGNTLDAIALVAPFATVLKRHDTQSLLPTQLSFMQQGIALGKTLTFPLVHQWSNSPVFFAPPPPLPNPPPFVPRVVPHPHIEFPPQQSHCKLKFGKLATRCIAFSMQLHYMHSCKNVCAPIHKDSANVRLVCVV